MGWLKDASVDAGIGSLEALARALKDAGAPGLRGREVANARSFANLLRAFDGGAALPPRLEAAVAAALALSVDDLRRKRDPRPVAHADADHAPHETLPPGYPARVLEPRRWSREWWDTRDYLAGEARAVIDQVVARHPYVHVVSAPTLAAAIDALPERGAAVVFVAETRGDEQRLERALPTHCALLVVASSGLGPAGDGASAWREVVEEGGDGAAMLAWLQPQVRDCDVARVAALVEAPRFADARRSPRRTLALARAIVDAGPDTVHAYAGSRLLAALLAQAGPRVRALGAQPERVIVGLIERLALRDEGLYAPFEPGLLEPLLPPLDAQLLRAASLDARISDAELGRRVRDALAPRALADVLAQLGWLTTCGERWRLAAHWLVPELLAELATSWSASGDTRALAVPEVAPLVVEHLYGRMAAGDLAPLDDAIAALDPARPRSVQRVEACLRAAGLAALAVHDGAWQAQVIEAFAVYSDVRRHVPSSTPTGRATRSWLAPEVWELALAALSRVVTSEPLSTQQQRRLERVASAAAEAMRGIPTIERAIAAFVARHCPDVREPDIVWDPIDAGRARRLVTCRSPMTWSATT